MIPFVVGGHIVIIILLLRMKSLLCRLLADNEISLKRMYIVNVDHISVVCQRCLVTIIMWLIVRNKEEYNNNY